MGILRLAAILPGLFLGSFLPWYFLWYPYRIFQNYGTYVKAFLEILSIPFLLKTLFSPWKSIVDEYPSNLMNFGEVAQVFTLNCTTRVIGFLFRSVALVFAIVSQAVLFVGFMSYLLLWLAYPGILVAAAMYFFGFM